MANDSGNNQPPSTAAAAVSQSPSSTPDSYIGSFISLTSKSEIRYEGVLDFLNTKDSSLGLKNVRSYGTEGRKKDGPQIPPNDKVFEFILFRGSDIKDLQVKSSPSPQVEESLDNDPAIIQSRYAGVSPSSSKSVSLNGGSFTEYGSYKGPASLNSVPPLHQSVNQTEYGASQATQSNMGSYAAPSYQQRYSEPASSHHAPQNSLPPSASHVMMQDLKQAYPLQGPEHFTSAVLPKSVAPGPVVTTANSLSLTSRQGLAPQQLPMAPTTNIVSPLLSVTSSMSSYAYTPAFPQSSQTVGNSGAPIFSRIGSNASPLYPVSPVVDSSSGVFPQQPPRLLTPDQLSLPSFSGQLYLDQKDLGVLSSEPQNPSLSFTTSAVQAPLLPLPPAAKKLQSSSEFTEEFDFVAMNEKFNKDEVWGYLGKAKQTAKKMEGVDIALVNEDKGNEVDHGLESNADPKPAYNKDDFFDNISRNTVARGGRNGQNRISQRMRQDSETFGNHQQRPYANGGYGPGPGVFGPGHGGYGPGHGGHRGAYGYGPGNGGHRGAYGYGWGRGFNNYGGRGRGGAHMRM
ncbi:protein decapping 5-like [Solanum pennellii]|uniref:Protein decapping 5-like n=1 Tax=Solanum pennellii TaxID=28526 RepID=A0ABM1HCR3_SOLPN|nr:protein decapping 5-like [Solanum pennellii]